MPSVGLGERRTGSTLSASKVNSFQTLGGLGEIAHVYPTMSTGISQMVAEDVFARIRRVRRLAKLSRLMG